jgi:hypothetical protein
MSYTPTTWTTGDTITASALNKIENGIANAGGGGGYDAEIYVYHDNSSGHNNEISIVSGNFASLYAMIQDATPPHVLLRVWDDLSNEYYTTDLVSIYVYSASCITFKPKIPTRLNGGCSDNDIVYGISLLWYSDDTLVLN